MKRFAKVSITGAGKDRTVLLNGLDITDFLISLDYHQGGESHIHMVDLTIVVSELNASDEQVAVVAQSNETEVRQIVRDELASILRKI